MNVLYKRGMAHLLEKAKILNPVNQCTLLQIYMRENCQKESLEELGDISAFKAFIEINSALVLDHEKLWSMCTPSIYEQAKIIAKQKAEDEEELKARKQNNLDLWHNLDKTLWSNYYGENKNPEV